MRTRGFASSDLSGFAIIDLVERKELDIQIYEYNVEINANPVNDSNNAAIRWIGFFTLKDAE